MKRFTLTSDNHDEVIPRIGQFLRSLNFEKPQRVTIDDKKETRSVQQNRRLHKIIGMCATESGYTIEEMKFTFKAELLEPEAWVDYKGRKTPIFKSTATMSVSELNEFMEGVENLAAQWYSVVLPFDEARYA